MFNKMLATVVVAGFATQAAFAGNCNESTRLMSSKNMDVNIKVKNDTKDPILVSIWKGTSTWKKTIFSYNELVPSDGKEGKTDNGVTDAEFFFSAKIPDSEFEAMCTFSAYTTTQTGLYGTTKETSGTVEYFECLDLGEFEISCEKSFNKDKDRWNVVYSIE